MKIIKYKRKESNSDLIKKSHNQIIRDKMYFDKDLGFNTLEVNLANNYYLRAAYIINGIAYLYPRGYVSEFKDSIEISFKEDYMHGEGTGILTCRGHNGDYFLAREDRTEEIIYEDDFIHGYKLVRFANGEFGYIKEYRRKLLPYRFDIATSFDKYGIALVAKNGTVGYITDDFKYLKPQLRWDEYNELNRQSYIKNGKGITFDDKAELLFPLEEDSNIENMDGFVKVTSFIPGPQPFSLVCAGPLYFVDPNGEIVQMSNYKCKPYSQETPEKYVIGTPYVTNLNDNAVIVLCDDDIRVYLPIGKYFTFHGLITFAEEHDLLNEEIANNAFLLLFPVDKRNIKFFNEIYRKKFEAAIKIVQNGLFEKVIELQQRENNKSKVLRINNQRLKIKLKILEDNNTFITI